MLEPTDQHSPDIGSDPVRLSEKAELVLLAVLAAYGRSAATCLPSVFRKYLDRPARDIAEGLDELMGEGLIYLHVIGRAAEDPFGLRFTDGREGAGAPI